MNPLDTVPVKRTWLKEVHRVAGELLHERVNKDVFDRFNLDLTAIQCEATKLLESSCTSRQSSNTDTKHPPETVENDPNIITV